MPHKSKKQNPCATEATAWRQFAAQITNPPYITHSAVTDKFDVERDILNVDTSEKRAQEEKRFAKYNQYVREVQKKQIPYILKELCKRANRPTTDADKYLTPENMTEDQFIDAFKQLRVKVNKQGQKLNTHNEVLNEAKAGPFGEKELQVGQDEIREILLQSTYKENIGDVKENFDNLIADNEKSAQRIEVYKKKLAEQTLKETGYTKEFLDNVFQYCNAGYGIPIAENYQRRRQDCIKARMNALPENQRTEEAFVNECEKLDRALRAYLLPKNGVKANDPAVFGVPSGAEYEKFALECISPTALARDVEERFNQISFIHNQLTAANRGPASEQLVDFDVDDLRDSDEIGAALGCIRHLENIHSKRSTWERFKDWFHFGKSESSTISRMKKALNRILNEEEKGKKIEVTYEGKTYGQRYQKLSQGKMIPANDPIAKETEAILAQEDVKNVNNAELHEAIKTTQEQQKTAEVDVEKDFGRVALHGKDLEETTKEEIQQQEK